MARRFLAASAALLLTCAAAFAQSAGGAAVAPGSIAPYVSNTQQSAREIAARQGRYFVFSTGNGGVTTAGGINVPAGDYLNVVACNVSTTKNVYVTLRIFDGNSTLAMVYGGIPSPAALSGTQVSVTAATTTTGTNTIAGGAASSVLQMTFGVGTTAVNNAAGNAVPSGVGYVYPATKNELNEIRIIPAGKCFGQYMYNVNTGVNAATVQMQYRMYEYEE